MREAEKEKKKILVANSVHTCPGQENFEKNSKKIQKIKKPLSGFISSQNEIRLAEKGEKKIIVPNSAHSRPRQEKSEKYSKKIKKI